MPDKIASDVTFLASEILPFLLATICSNIFLILSFGTSFASYDSPLLVALRTPDSLFLTEAKNACSTSFIAVLPLPTLSCIFLISSIIFILSECSDSESSPVCLASKSLNL